MNIKHCLSRHLIIVSLVLGFNVPVFAEFSSMTDEVFVQRQDQAVWVVEFACDGSNDTVSIEQKISADKWCVVGVDNICAQSKRDLATQVCQSDFIRASANGVIAQEAPSVAPTQIPAKSKAAVKSVESKQKQQAQARSRATQSRLIAEQNDLQKQLNDLEQERNALRQTELELDAQEAQIKKELEQLDN